MNEDRLGLPEDAFAKLDQSEDELFYEPPRLVYHIDEHAVAALTDFYRRVLPAGGVLLDLMSSWVSHLPPEADYAEVIGHGMNAEELAANPRLTRRFTQNLNRDTALPLAAHPSIQLRLRGKLGLQVVLRDDVQQRPCRIAEHVRRLHASRYGAAGLRDTGLADARRSERRIPPCRPYARTAFVAVHLEFRSEQRLSKLQRDGRRLRREAAQSQYGAVHPEVQAKPRRQIHEQFEI